jgi:hypothetical protein
MTDRIDTPPGIISLLEDAASKSGKLRTFSEPKQQAFYVNLARGDRALLDDLDNRGQLPTDPVGSDEILYTVVNPLYIAATKYIPSYYLYTPRGLDPVYVVTTKYIFLHKPIPSSSNGSIILTDYVLISNWIEEPYEADKHHPRSINTAMQLVSQAQVYSIQNPRFRMAVFKDTSASTPTYLVYSYEGERNIFDEYESSQVYASSTATTTTTTVTTTTAITSPYAASQPAQPPVTIQSIHQKLLPLFTSGTGGTTWNPLLAHSTISVPVVFKGNTNTIIRSLNPSLPIFNETENGVLDAISPMDAEDSVSILKSMFDNMNQDSIERRSYFVIHRNGKKLVATYDRIFLHKEINPSSNNDALNLLIDSSQQTALQLSRYAADQPTRLLIPGPTVPNPPSDPLVQTNSQINPGPSFAQPAMPSFAQPSVAQPSVAQPAMATVAQPVTITNHAVFAQHAAVAPDPASTTAFVSLPATPVPIVAQPNTGAQATSPSCDAGTENCYVWKFTDASEGWLPNGLQFNVPLDAMSQRRSIDSVTNGEYKLTFAGPSGPSTHVTHIKISRSPESYDLAAIRPDKMDRGMSSYQSTAVFEKTGSAGTIFVRCTLEVKHSSSTTRPGVYAEWVVPHIDTGRWVTTGNGDASQLPPLIPKTETVPMDYRGSEPASVVSSFAPAARYDGEPMEYRINGLDENTVASKTGNNDKEGGYVRDAEAQEKGYDLGRLRDNYPPSKKTLNHIYFDGNAYKTNPHFRFRPPWWSSENPQFRIACVGDSLTEGWMCDWSGKLPNEDPRTYPNLLRTYLADVGIPASVENFGISGAKMWSKSQRSALVVNYQDAIDSTKPTSDTNWFGKAQGTYDLMIIWLGTNDAAEIGNEIDKQGENIIQVQIQGDFEKIIRHRPAKHYLLVEIDGRRRNQNAIAQNLPCLESQPGNIDAKCETDRNEKKGAECINKAIAALEQKYQNVHVASIDFMKERCPGGERPSGSSPFYIHFASNEGIAKSIFGRIMCHAIFHRETGDLRWVGAEPNKKLKKPLQSL